MATTTNYSWSTPDDTALVKDGAAAIRSLGTAIDTTVFTNAGAAITKATVDAKGDLIAGTADNTVARLAVGANNTILVADSSTATGLKWAAPAGGGKVLQVVSATYSTLSFTTSASYVDTGLTASITPSANTSKILVLVNHANSKANNANNGTQLTAQFNLVRTSTELTYNNMGFNHITTTNGQTKEFFSLQNFMYLDSPSTTSSTTYKTQYKTEISTRVEINDGGVSSIILLEIGA
jgi:hypothetical protein